MPLIFHSPTPTPKYTKGLGPRLIDRLQARVGGFKDRIAPTRDCRSRPAVRLDLPQFRVPLCLR